MDDFENKTKEEYVVSDTMKKVWAVELDLLKVFDNACKKWGLKYYAAYGTLLGAVRHQGFIPWDDDIDVAMMRDDYEKLKTVVKEEFTGKYCFQDWYNSSGRTWIFSKLRNSETTAVEFVDKGPEFNQGMFIDIYPLDEFDDGINVNKEFKKAQKDLFHCINNPINMLKGVLDGQKYFLDTDTIVALANDYVTSQKLFEQLTLENFGQSDLIGNFYDEIRGNGKCYSKSLYDEVIYMPFENIKIPIPKGYDTILRKYYGDYMKPAKIPNNHAGLILDPDKPYTEYIKK